MYQQDSKLKKIGQKAYLSYHQDGIIDLVIGLCTLGFGIRMLNNSILFMIFSWLPILFYLPLKKAITYPRLGYVQFARSKTAPVLALLVVVGLIVLIFALGIFFPIEMKGVLQQYDMLMLILESIIVIGLILIGALTGIKRMYAYAALYGLGMPVSITLGANPVYSVLIASAIVLCYAVVLLTQFLRRFPVSPEDGYDEIS